MMINDCRQENDRLKTELQNRPSSGVSSQSGTTGDDDGYKEKLEALVNINHGWKKDYGDLQMRYEMLTGEKRLLENKERELKIRINELEKRQAPLEGEILRLATALYAQQHCNIRRPSEEQCEVLRSQMIVYNEEFERERVDSENVNEDKQKFKQKLEDAEDTIRKLTAELDACKALEEARRQRGHWNENGYLNERDDAPRHQVQLVHPSVL